MPSLATCLLHFIPALAGAASFEQVQADRASLTYPAISLSAPGVYLTVRLRLPAELCQAFACVQPQEGGVHTLRGNSEHQGTGAGGQMSSLLSFRLST